MNGLLPETTSPQFAAGTDAWVELLRTLADPIRLRIIRLLEQQVHHGLSVGELSAVLKLPQSTVSRHLKTLMDAGLAAAQRDATSMFYRLSEAAGHNSIKHLRQLSKQQLDHDPIAKTDAQRLAHVLRQRQDATANFFGHAAPKWDQIRRDWFGDTFHLEAMLALLDPRWVLADLGAGTGFMLPVLAPHVARIIAVEPVPAMLNAARARVRQQKLVNVELRQGSLEKLPIDSASVDIALLALVLHYTIDPTIPLREVRRCLKPGGIILIIDLQPHQVDLFRAQMGHRWMGFAQDQLESWLGEAGFVNARWHPLAARTARSKENATPVPDLFALRAEADSKSDFTTESQRHRGRTEGEKK